MFDLLVKHDEYHGTGPDFIVGAFPREGTS